MNDITAATRLVPPLTQNLLALRTFLGNTADLSAVSFTINGIRCAAVSIEGMVSSESVGELVFRPLMALENGTLTQPDKLMTLITEHCIISSDRTNASTVGSCAELMFAGFVLIFVDGVPAAEALGIQGYPSKAIAEPTSENDLLSSQEAFTETVRTNISLVRRRMRTSKLRFELLKCGKLSGTEIAIAYIEGKADRRMVAQVRKRIRSIGLDSVLGPAFILPFLERQSEKLLFSEIGTTERPDMLCADLVQGRIGVLIDGAPFALVCPYLFAQGFDSIDDYAAKTYFAVFIKLIRCLSFMLAAAFPGVYIAAVNFNPEMLNMKLLLSLAAGERSTMLSLFSEMLIVMLLLEILREASIRLPHAIGTAVSIAGGLIIGDAAVKSGIISSPLLIVVGITATASYVLPAFAQQLTVLRLLFIFAGGFAGFFGISVCAVMVTANICSQSFVGIPYTSPFSPLRRKRIMNVTGRKNFADLARESPTIKEFE